MGNGYLISFNEDVVEQAALAWLEETGYTRLHGLAIAPGELPALIDIGVP